MCMASTANAASLPSDCTLTAIPESSPTNVLPAGTSVTLTASCAGGDAPIRYLWGTACDSHVTVCPNPNLTTRQTGHDDVVRNVAHQRRRCWHSDVDHDLYRHHAERCATQASGRMFGRAASQHTVRSATGRDFRHPACVLWIRQRSYWLLLGRIARCNQLPGRGTDVERDVHDFGDAVQCCRLIGCGEHYDLRGRRRAIRRQRTRRRAQERHAEWRATGTAHVRGDKGHGRVRRDDCCRATVYRARALPGISGGVGQDQHRKRPGHRLHRRHPALGAARAELYGRRNGHDHGRGSGDHHAVDRSLRQLARDCAPGEVV